MIINKYPGCEAIIPTEFLVTASIGLREFLKIVAFLIQIYDEDDLVHAIFTFDNTATAQAAAPDGRVALMSFSASATGT